MGWWALVAITLLILNSRNLPISLLSISPRAEPKAQHTVGA